jgi:tRNA(fMet)-specific endonuclease VapC
VSSSDARLTDICIYVMKNYPQDLRERFNSLAEQLCISNITLGELHFGAEKSSRRVDNLTAIEHFVARLDVLPFGSKAAAHYGQVRAELERGECPAVRTTCRLAVMPAARD